MMNSKWYKVNRLNGVLDGPHTNMSFENSYGHYAVSLPKDDLPLDEIIDSLVRPLLLAAGYHEESINNYIME